jgi:hypothetical protein
MDELKRNNWDAIGKHQARQGEEYQDRYVRCLSFIIPFGQQPCRCRARSSCRGHYFEPITFGETSPAPIEGISVTHEDTEDTDKVPS